MTLKLGLAPMETTVIQSKTQKDGMVSMHLKTFLKLFLTTFFSLETQAFPTLSQGLAHEKEVTGKKTFNL